MSNPYTASACYRPQPTTHTKQVKAGKLSSDKLIKEVEGMLHSRRA